MFLLWPSPTIEMIVNNLLCYAAYAAQEHGSAPRCINPTAAVCRKMRGAVLS